MLFTSASHLLNVCRSVDRFRRLVILLVLAALVPVARAATPAGRRSYQLAGGDAATTLRQFVEQSGEQVVYLVPKVRGVTTNPVTGEFTAREVLERMLAHTALIIVEDQKTGALLVQRATNGTRPPAVPPAAPPKTAAKPSSTSTMQTPSLLTRVVVALASLAAPIATAAQPAPTTNDPGNNPVQLSPFEVRSDLDVGYVATSSLAGSRMNTDLRDTPVAISVFTRDFLDDIGKVDVNQAIEYGLNTISEVGFTGNDFNENNFNFRIRGIGSAQRARNYFKTQLNLDVYNTERIDFARGPNAILFGEASPSGIVNTSTKFARLNQNRTSIQFRAASYDDRRVSLDVNRSIGRNLAVRANVLWQDAEGYREFEYKKKKGFALAGTWRPFAKTQIRLEGESIDIDENRSRPWPAYDAFSVWEAAGRQGAGSATTWGTNNATGTTRLLGGNGLIVADSGVLGGVPLYMNSAAPIAVGDPNQFRVSTGPTNIPGLNQSPQVLDFSRHPRNGNLAGAGARSDSAAQVGGIYVEQQIGDNLTIELAAGAEYEKRLWSNPIGFAGITVRYDANAFLPTFDASGQQNGIVANPNFRRQFTFGTHQDRGFKNYRVQERATATYNLELDKLFTGRPKLGKILGRHRLAALVSNEDFITDVLTSRETNISPSRLNANYFAGANLIQRLSYVDMFSDNRAERGARDPRLQPLNNATIANRSGLNAGGGTVTNAMVRDTWTWNKNILGTRMFAMQNYFLNGRLVGLFGWRHDDLKSYRSTQVRNSVTSEGTGFIRDPAPAVDVSGRTFTRGLVGHVTPWLSLYVNEADNFQVQGATQVFGNVARTSGAVDSRPAIGNKKGEGRDAGVKFNLFNGKLYASLGWYRVADANRFTNVDGNFVNNNGLVEAIWTAINNDTPLYDVMGNDTQATVSQGYELEIVANPTKQLRFSLNLKNADTKVSDLFPAITSYMAEHRDTWLAPANANKIVGTGFGSATGKTVAQVVAETDLLLRTVKAPEGRAPVMDRKITGNLFAKYSFTSGFLKNFAIGGGVNYRDKALLAYRIQTDQAAAYTPAYTDYNALLQYGGRLWREKLRYTLQLNVDNLTDNQKPQAVNGGQAVPGNASQAILPTMDGVVPFFILPEPRRFSVSATFTF
ncbi:MAG TPA: TonB-dependent receptor plug domain-containing protein [Opitutaceae bacterium]|nr:TonB-dependent receptor plug domain-containing protein [Opitutaceae bacterium]